MTVLHRSKEFVRNAKHRGNGQNQTLNENYKVCELKTYWILQGEKKFREHEALSP